MEPEKIIANFLKLPGEGGAYTDEKLAALLAHAEDGKLAFTSCCCLIGIPTADHALRGAINTYPNQIIWDEDYPEHYLIAKYGRADIKSDPVGAALPGMHEVEVAFCHLSEERSDEDRRTRLIPLIKSEMQRRESLRSQKEVSEVVMV